MKNEEDFYHNVSDGKTYVSEEYLFKKMRSELLHGVVAGVLAGLAAGWIVTRFL